MVTEPCNKNAIPEVRNVLDYFAGIEGRRIITGQHTQTREQEELIKIQEITGKLPALCGFELLSYSPNFRRETADEACLQEVDANKGTLDEAWKWAEKGGLITFTWHWFSPSGGWDKSFYSKNTEFDAEKALEEGTPEHAALCGDLDHMAAILTPFCEKKVPILWRPFHEAEGDWFWWGAKGPEVAKQLYRFMYRYFTEKYQLNNLIWVWNSPLAEGYVGDDCCDIISRDLYPPAHAHGDFNKAYRELARITPAPKGTAVAETGILPDPDALAASGTPWLWYMTWSGGFALTEDFNGYDALCKLYHHAYAVTLEQLPQLYGPVMR
ncbi:MAG: glycosyl hydrolase [Roseburia sp.]